MTETFNIRQVILKNMSFQVVSQFLSLGLSLIATGVLSRYLGVEAYGQFNYLYAFYYLFMTLNDFGMDTVVIRDISQRRERAGVIIGTMSLFKICTSLVLAGAAWISVELMTFDPVLESSLKIFALILPGLALQLPGLIFNVVLKLEYPAVIGFFMRIINFAVILLLVLNGCKLQALAMGMVACEFLSAGVIFFFSRKFLEIKWQFDAAEWKQIIKPSLCIGITGIFVALINRADFIMLERLRGIHDVGIYASMYKVTSLLETLPLLLMSSIFPLFSKYASTDRAALGRVYRKANRLLFRAAIVLGIFITISAPFIIRVLFGAQYLEAVRGLQILVWATVALYLALPAGNLLISVGLEKFNLIANMIAALLNIALNFLLIPKMGVTGAAIATAAAYGSLAVFLRLAAAKKCIFD